ncbi:MAG: MetQ/NlpA family ABC transporter substrate-binding protein [Promicromonosporaceae bacterium]|nr:MetQ/NlpA family ABC transporter substrate-binding protein [Promicromonosporaceae bacterium]
MNRRFTSAKLLTFATVAALALSACAGDAASPDAALGTAERPLRIGIINAEDAYRDTLRDLARAEGIYLEWVNFSDFSIPNLALAEGDLDLNQFQHIQFLANFNVATGSNLVPIGATAVYPLGLYSLRHDSLADFPRGAEIAIPNDPTNQARALLVLQAAGLITLRDGGNSLSTPADILREESIARVIPVEAAQTAISLHDIDGSIVNNSMIPQVGLTLADAIFADDPSSLAAEPYINVWVTRAEDAENETFHRLIALFHASPTVIEGLRASSADTAAVRNNPALDLQRILAEIEANLRNQ